MTNEPYKTISTHIRNMTQSNAPKAFWFMSLNSRHYNCLLFSMSAGHTFFLSTDVSLVDFNATFQQITSGPNHSSTQFVKPCPSSLITAQAQHSLHSQRASAKLLVGYMPRCLKPHPHRLASAIKYRLGGYRGLTLAASTSDLLPICHPPLGPSAGRANKTIGPAQFQQICCTRLFSRKPFIKFLYRARIVNAANRKIFHSRVIHAPTIYLRDRNGYPPFLSNRFSPYL